VWWREVSAVAEIREPGGLGYKLFTVLGVLFFLVVVAVLIRSYEGNRNNSAGEVSATAPEVAAAAPAEVAGSRPVGAVATGGGGTAGDSAGVALQVFTGLVTGTVLIAGAVIWWRRSLTPV
jgi:hypothetical protein